MLCRPTDPPSRERFVRQLEDALQGAASAAPAPAAPLPSAPGQRAHGQGAPAPSAVGGGPSSYQTTLVAIGASTGGVEATEAIVRRFPEDVPPTLLVQHIRGHFADAHAERLDRISPCEVAIATHGDVVRAGRVLVAPGDRHMTVVRRSGRIVVQLDDGPPVNYHRPSVDRLFQSVALLATRRAVGVLLTGMGNDGAAGLLEMRSAGMRTIAQDESTSAVYGMPRAAVELGAVQDSLPLDLITGRVLWGTTQPKENRTWG
ncbi:MAG: CheB methylesterase domain-containing protein [Planctomycetota bacterium]